MFFEELLNATHRRSLCGFPGHARGPLRQKPRTARGKRVVVELPLGMPLHSERERRRSVREKPRRLHPGPEPRLEVAPEGLHALECSEFTVMRAVPASRSNTPPRVSSISCAGAYCSSSGASGPRDGFAAPRLRAASARACRRTRRSSPESRDKSPAAAARLDDVRNHRQRRRVPGHIVQRARIARRPAVPMRFDVRRAAGQQDAIEVREQLTRFEPVTERRDQPAPRERLPLRRGCTSRRRSGSSGGPAAPPSAGLPLTGSEQETFKIFNSRRGSDDESAPAFNHRTGLSGPPGKAPMWPFLGLTRACADLRGRPTLARRECQSLSCRPFGDPANRYEILNRVSPMAAAETSYYSAFGGPGAGTASPRG